MEEIAHCVGLEQSPVGDLNLSMGRCAAGKPVENLDKFPVSPVPRGAEDSDRVAAGYER